MASTPVPKWAALGSSGGSVEGRSSRSVLAMPDKRVYASVSRPTEIDVKRGVVAKTFSLGSAFNPRSGVLPQSH